MNINATLLIQAFNFFIVYWMLRLFLFKPIITIIDDEHAEEKAMLDIIDQQQKSLEIQEKERRRHWYVCQEYFTIHQPYITTHQFLTTEKMQDVPIIIHKTSADEITRVTSDIRSRLEEKIKHVHQ